MRRQGRDTAQHNMLLRVDNGGVDGDGPEDSPCLTSVSPVSRNSPTSRRIVRTLNTVPVVTQLVNLDGAPQHSISVRTSTTVLSEDILEELTSGSGSATSIHEESIPMMGPSDEFYRMSPSLNPGTQRTMSRSGTRMTVVDSIFSGSSFFSDSSAHSVSQQYTEAFDVESVYGSSSTFAGDTKTGSHSESCLTSFPDATTATVRTVSNTIAAPPFASDSISSLMEGDSLEEKDSNIERILPSHRSTSTVDAVRRQKCLNVRREERIGRGFFGDVFRAIDLNTGLPLVIKEIVVTADISKDVEKQICALEREIRVMRKLNHKHIVSYYSSRRDEGSTALQIYMEYVGGGTIAQNLRANGAFSEDEARCYTYQLLEGLEYLHTRCIVHRDLKGDNLFLTEDGVLKVGDFGTSKDLQTTLVTNSVAGTPNFMAPEVIACSGHSCMADIWSVGCCVLEMLTGHPPFWNLDNHMAVMFAIMKGRLDDQIPSHISEEAKSFIGLCLRNDPKDRPTAAQLKKHIWLRCMEDVDLETHLESCLSLSSLKGISEGGEKRKDDGATQQYGTSSSHRNDAFQSSTTAVVAIIPQGVDSSSEIPCERLRHAGNKKGIDKHLPEAHAQHTPGVATASINNSNTTGRRVGGNPLQAVSSIAANQRSRPSAKDGRDASKLGAPTVGRRPGAKTTKSERGVLPVVEVTR